MAARIAERRRSHAAREARPLLGQHATVTQRVGLVEEDDYAAVAQRKLPQLTEQRLDLENADAHEHVREGARVDEYVRLARLARDRLGHKGLPSAGRAPQQQAARHITALLLDLMWTLEVEDVLLDPRHDMILTPYVGESGLDVVGVVDVDAAARQEPEDRHELEDDEEEREGELQDKRHGLPQKRRELEDREHRRQVHELADHEDEQRR